MDPLKQTRMNMSPVPQFSMRKRTRRDMVRFDFVESCREYNGICGPEGLLFMPRG